MITKEELQSSNETINELDTISLIKVFDVQYEIGGYSFYFRCTKISSDNLGQENTIEFLEEDSDSCDNELLEYMKDKIINLYL